ncbi:hypothetical protein SPHINGOT1_70147 [Sphingomonas sp. T1]|nr:hypothetical protein SPHINGOT1_70147 [Sphingomonas sp. T1]
MGGGQAGQRTRRLLWLDPCAYQGDGRRRARAGTAGGLAAGGADQACRARTVHDGGLTFFPSRKREGAGGGLALSPND